MANYLKILYDHFRPFEKQLGLQVCLLGARSTISQFAVSHVAAVKPELARETRKHNEDNESTRSVLDAQYRAPV